MDSRRKTSHKQVGMRVKLSARELYQEKILIPQEARKAMLVARKKALKIRTAPTKRVSTKKKKLLKNRATESWSKIWKDVLKEIIHKKQTGK